MAEKLNFKIKLEPGVLTSINKAPYCKIGLNDQILKEGYCTEATTFEFDAELDDGEHELRVQFTNKDHKRNTFTDNSGKIVEDLYLNVTGVTIDDIDLGNLLSKSTYNLYEAVEFNGQRVSQLQGHTFLSWNGTFCLKFTSPFYLWLLENL